MLSPVLVLLFLSFDPPGPFRWTRPLPVPSVPGFVQQPLQLRTFTVDTQAVIRAAAVNISVPKAVFLYLNILGLTLRFRQGPVYVHVCSCTVYWGRALVGIIRLRKA